MVAVIIMAAFAARLEDRIERLAERFASDRRERRATLERAIRERADGPDERAADRADDLRRRIADTEDGPDRERMRGELRDLNTNRRPVPSLAELERQLESVRNPITREQGGEVLAASDREREIDLREGARRAPPGDVRPAPAHGSTRDDGTSQGVLERGAGIPAATDAERRLNEGGVRDPNVPGRTAETERMRLMREFYEAQDQGQRRGESKRAFDARIEALRVAAEAAPADPARETAARVNDPTDTMPRVEPSNPSNPSSPGNPFGLREFGTEPPRPFPARGVEPRQNAERRQALEDRIARATSDEDVRDAQRELDALDGAVDVIVDGVTDSDRELAAERFADYIASLVESAPKILKFTANAGN